MYSVSKDKAKEMMLNNVIETEVAELKNRKYTN